MNVRNARNELLFLDYLRGICRVLIDFLCTFLTTEIGIFISKTSLYEAKDTQHAGFILQTPGCV